jgi:hypothetical protein
MTTLQYAALTLIALISAAALAALFGAFTKLGAPEYEELDAKLVLMEIAQDAKEDGWIVIEQARLANLRQRLDVHRAIVPRTEAVIHKMAEIHSAITQAEMFLGTLNTIKKLKKPYPNDRRHNAATWMEGRG